LSDVEASHEGFSFGPDVSAQSDNPLKGDAVMQAITARLRSCAGGTVVTIARVPTVQPQEGRAMFFVVEPDRARLADLAQRLRDGRLKPIVGAVRRSPKRLLRLPRTCALLERRSSGSSKADSRLRAGRLARPSANSSPRHSRSLSDNRSTAPPDRINPRSRPVMR
jgi:hypothetical protein